MVWDTKDEKMTDHDWRVLGHTYIPKHGNPTLPTRRLDIPLPSTAGGLHTLALRLQELSNEIHRTARQQAMGASNRLCIHDAMSQLELARQRFKLLRQDWETELRETPEPAPKGQENRERLRLIAGTGEAK